MTGDGDAPRDATGDGAAPVGGDDADAAPREWTDEDLGALQGDAEALEGRVDALLEQSAVAVESFEPPEDPDERALEYCREGLWPVLAAYVDRRGAGASLGQPHHDRLETALNRWLALYARCYGVEVDPEVPVRQAAELFVSTHNVRDVAQLLTDVPERRQGAREE